MSWPRAVLFDFDGVLVNSEPLHFYAFYDTLRDEKIEITEQEYYREYLGYDDRVCFERVFQNHGRPLDPKAFLRVMTRKKEKMMEQILSRKYQALPGVEQFVRGLWRLYPLAICSGAQGDEIETMLEGIALRDCFGVIVSAQDVENSKPHPEGYLLAAELLSRKLKPALAPGDCLVVEDAPKVVASVMKAGFRTLAVTTSHPAERLAQADWVVPSLEPHVVQHAIPGLKLLTDAMP